MTATPEWTAGAVKTRGLQAGMASTQGGRLAPLLVSLLCVCCSGRAALGQSLYQSLWGTGTVDAIARSGNTLYVAGALGEAGPNTGGGIPLSSTTGAPVTPYLKVTGYVDSAVPDGRVECSESHSRLAVHNIEVTGDVERSV